MGAAGGAESEEVHVLAGSSLSLLTSSAFIPRSGTAAVARTVARLLLQNDLCFAFSLFPKLKPPH